jgi:tRNA pseudouridine38-40 synthase
MERYQVILAYDGSSFQGFQRQGQPINNVLTVQGAVEAALRQLGWQGQTILAAGRTDTGVHASGQVITFDLDWPHGPETLLKAINANLPEAVAVNQVRVVPADFHPRFDAIGRTYCYTLYLRQTRDPLRERYAWRVWPSLDIVVLQQAANLFLGSHNFAAFGTPPRVNGSTVRTVKQAEWTSDGDQLSFTVTADAFLYHMVRRMVYVQVAVSHSRIEMAALTKAVQNPAESAIRLAPGLASPHGLVLTKVHYSADWHRPRINQEDQPDQFEQE